MGTQAFSQDVLETRNQKDSAVPMNVIAAKVINDKSVKKTHVKKKYKSKKKKNPIPGNKLESRLTPAEKEKIKQQENKPRRGVTNLPNERTAK